MILEAAGHYCEMTLNKFWVGISNNSESNLFQHGNTPLKYSILSISCMPVLKTFPWTSDDVWSNRVLLWNDGKQILLWDCQQFWIQHVPIWEHFPWIFYLVNFVRACAENFETTDDFWSSRVLLWNDVNQILWDCQQFWIQHIPIWEHPLEYSILSISFMPVQKILNLLMIFEAAGHYCEMTLNRFCFGIANNSESNMFQHGNTPLKYYILSISCMPVLKTFQWTSDNFWSSRVLLWNDVNQIQPWDCQQFWIQHVPM